MPSCGAPGCVNRSANNPDKSFHHLPPLTKRDLREKWLAKIKRKNIPKDICICSDHFEKECFQRDLKVRNGVFLALMEKYYL